GRVEKHATGMPRICWHTILTCGNPQWYGKPLKQRGLPSRQGGHSSRYWCQQDSVFARTESEGRDLRRRRSFGICRQAKWGMAYEAKSTRVSTSFRSPLISRSMPAPRYCHRSICWMPDMQTKFVEANGLRFEVLEQDTGVRLALCLHGFPEHAISWRHQIPAPEIKLHRRGR